MATIGPTAPSAARHPAKGTREDHRRGNPGVNDLRQLHVSVPAEYLTNATRPYRG